MGNGRLGKILTKAWLGLVVFLVFSTHGASARVSVPITLNNGRTVYISFSDNFFASQVECLCDDKKPSCVFYTNILHTLYGIPQTVTGKIDQLANWRIDISYDDYNQAPWKRYEFNMTKSNSDDSASKCLTKKCYHIFVGTSSCKDEPEMVYIGGNRMMEIDDRVQVCSYEYNSASKDSDCEEFKDVTGGSKEDEDTDDNEEMVIDEEADSMASVQSQSSRDTAPLVAGVIIAVIAFLIIIAIVALFLWRWKLHQNKQEHPTGGAFSSGACRSAEFVNNENAQNEAAEGGDSQSVSTPPPSYNEVEGNPYANANTNPQHGFTNDAFAVSDEITLR